MTQNLNQTLTLNPTPPLSSSLTPTISQNSNPVTLKHDPNQGAGVCNSDFQGAGDGKMSGPVSGRHVFRILPLPPPHSLARDVTLTTATDDVVWRGEASWTRRLIGCLLHACQLSNSASSEQRAVHREPPT